MPLEKEQGHTGIRYGGRCIPDDTGGNTWVEDKNSKQAYLKLKMDKDKMAKLIESIMLNEF